MLYVALSKWYKLRVRDNPVNIHTIAENHIIAISHKKETLDVAWVNWNLILMITLILVIGINCNCGEASGICCILATI